MEGNHIQNIFRQGPLLAQNSSFFSAEKAGLDHRRHVLSGNGLKVVFAMGSPSDDEEGQESGGVVTEREIEVKEPSLYKVLLLNDDYTPMDFVIEVLETCFNMDHAKATGVMLSVHEKGAGLCGIFPYSVAETKVAQVNELAKKNEHPLQCTMEPA